MQCSNCGGGHLVPRTYVTTRGERLPACECGTCATLLLDESLGRTDEEKAAIRRVMASRSGKVVPIQRRK
jgi:hypothetical protein